ncbi:DsbA family protein [Phenylobacterium sp.]|uniref:DsbA family protein n=1 Tax=Phenylobacterium sp. TaxID=1871053 RepID=UPI002735FCF0|nr:thioredoxin domain-containing protein [Phenylobacterium sp.]MDP3853715.1 thioredoxin domain-containing protein [Phenylobacterium sp.]
MALETPPGPRPSLVARRPRLTLAIALLLGAAMSFYLQNRPPPWRALTLTPVVAAVLKDDGGPRIGPDDADVVVVVFTDYQCPVCKRTDAALERVAANDGRVRVVYKDWPILGEASVLAARAALAADAQGKYADVHRALMASRSKLDAERIRDIAIEAGADWPRLQADQAARAGEIEARLNRQAGQAWSLGVEGTPAYLVGPYLVKGGLDDRDLARAVAAARKAGPPR